MKKAFVFFSLFFWGLKVSLAEAICPICTVAVGAGLGLSQWLGIDDTISGLWIGGITVSVIMWTINWMDRKNKNFKFRNSVIWIAWIALIIVPLFFTGFYHPLNSIWGLNKLVLGIILGGVSFFGGAVWYQSLKAKNGGHAHFPFQKVVMAIGPLIILSAVFYFLTA